MKAWPTATRETEGKVSYPTGPILTIAWVLKALIVYGSRSHTGLDSILRAVRVAFP